MMPVTTYCGEHYDARQAWKNLQAEEAEYLELLTLQDVSSVVSSFFNDLPDLTFCLNTTFLSYQTLNYLQTTLKLTQ